MHHNEKAANTVTQDTGIVFGSFGTEYSAEYPVHHSIHESSLPEQHCTVEHVYKATQRSEQWIQHRT